MTVLLWGGTAFSADRVEYEGRLATNVPGPSGRPDKSPPRVRVVTEDGRVTQISFYERARGPGYEVFDFAGASVTRYRLYSGPGKLQEAYDLTGNAKMPAVKRERVNAGAEVLLRHFKKKGGYRRVSSN